MNKIICLIFLFIIVCLVYLSLKYKEQFINNLKWKLIDKKTASKVISNIDTFNRYTYLDRKLRNISKEENINQHYINKLLDWTEIETKLLKWLLDGIYSKTPNKYLFLYNNVWFAKYENSVEMGFPHTHDNIIFLTGKFVNNILSYFNKNELDKCISNIGLIIIHECVHIWQRKDPDFFINLYKLWNFKYNKKIYNFNKIMKKSRYNPDGVYINWTYKFPNNDREIIPLAVYKNDANNIGHVNNIGVFCEKIGNKPVIPPFPKTEFLINIKEYSNFFGNIAGNNYHPNELSAELIAFFYIELILNEKRHSSKAYQYLKKCIDYKVNKIDYKL